MKDDEKQLLIELYQANLNKRVYPRDLLKDNKLQYIPYKRLVYILEKWTNKGLFEYGIGPLFGWLTNDGITKAKKLMGEQPWLK